MKLEELATSLSLKLLIRSGTLNCVFFPHSLKLCVITLQISGIEFFSS